MPGSTAWRSGRVTSVGVGYDLVEPAFDLDVVEFESVGFGVTPGAEYGAVTCRLRLEML